jgi:VWFA-related protein
LLETLDRRNDGGLIPLAHEARLIHPPAGDPDKVPATRRRVEALIRDAKPRPQGGAAHFDAAIEAARMLEAAEGRRAIVLLTNGLGRDGKAGLDDAVAAAHRAQAPVHVIGVGAPVTTVLVLDRSGSMRGKADEEDRLSKMDALKAAAKRFVELMRPGDRAIVQSFSTRVDPLTGDFTDDKAALTAQIDVLEAQGGTALYAATYAGLMTLEAGGVGGKRVVVVLTDGVDEANEELRRSDDEVAAQAREMGVPLYVFGLGQKDQINEEVMIRMARDAGGRYDHVGSQKHLLEVFEKLSVRLRDPIGEEPLKELARKTGGQYLHVEDAGKRSVLCKELADKLRP